MLDSLADTRLASPLDKEVKVEKIEINYNINGFHVAYKITLLVKPTLLPNN